MDATTLFIDSFVIGFSGAMMPGPLLAVDIAESPRNGWKTGPVISVGHAIAEIAVVVILAAGVTTISEGGMTARVIGVVGGLALLAMAAMMTFDTLKNRVAYQAGQAGASSPVSLAAKGITTTLVNPYWFVWWATIGVAMIVQSRELGYIGPVIFYFGHIMSDFVWYTVVSVLIWRGRNVIMGNGLRILLLACAAFLLYLGVKFLYTGLTGGI